MAPKVSDEALSYITNDKELLKQVWLGLQKRCYIIEAKFGLRMSTTRLKRIYKQHRIKYGRPEWVYDRALAKGPQLLRERQEYA